MLILKAEEKYFFPTIESYANRIKNILFPVEKFGLLNREQ